MTRFRSSLILRISAAFASFAGVLLIGVGLLSYSSGRSALEAAAVSELLSSAIGKEAHIDEWLRNQVADVETLAHSPALDEAMQVLASAPRNSDAALRARAVLVAEMMPRTQILTRRHLILAIADAANGELVAATSPELLGKSIAIQPYFVNGLRNSFVQNPHLSQVLNRPTITIGTPIRSANGPVQGVLVAWFELAEMNNTVQQRTGLRRSDDAYLVNPQREFVTQPRFLKQPVVLQEKVNTEAVRRALAGNSGVFLGMDYRQVPAIIVYRWLPTQKLAMITLIEQDEALASANEFGVTIFAISVLVLILASGLSIVLARTIVRPVRALQEGVTRFGQGELAVRLPVTSDNELGQLAREFNNMANAIAEKNAQLVGNSAQLELRVQERTQALQRQADLLELAHDAIIVHQPDGTIEFWNHGAQETYGWSSKDAIGRTTQSLLKTDSATPRAEFDAQLLSNGRWEGEVTHLRRDGTPIVVASRQAVRYDATGGAAAILEINSDISERKYAEQQLTKAKEAAEAATRAKSDFLANMSHEIRTPMNGVIGLTNLALKTTLTQQQHEYLRLIKVSADSLLRLLNDILDFSKMEARKLELDVIEFDVRESIGNTLKAFAASANEKSLELIHHVMPDVPLNLLGDPGRLAQVIVNLTGNALKFTKQGEIVVRVKQQSRQGNFIVMHFSISDSGIGISREQQSYIFNAFAQADTSTTRQYGGTGLGLAIVAQLVELMEGTIWIDSEPGQGTTFHFTAKFAMPPALERGELQAKPLSGLENMGVLVVDDNRTNRTILAEILSNWSMRPVLAEDGREALAILQREAARGDPFPLILMDAQMPDFNGFDLAEAIKEDPALESATIMMLSSGDLAAELIRCKALGVKRVLSKPVKQSELFDAIAMATGVASNERIPLAELAVTGTAKSARHLHVLIAEDNMVNQRLVIDILQERGHTFEVANNGLEVLDLLQKSRFDLILMDGQMPEMDGYQATREIRRREQSTGQHIRIIAVTAHAMKEDREICLTAGMDDYVTKPIDAAQLIERVEWQSMDDMRAPSSDGATEGKSVTAAGIEIFNLQTALKRVRGKQALLQELVKVFLQDLPTALAELDSAVATGDTGLLERTAHRVRGAAITLSASALAQQAELLEQLGRAQAHTDIGPAVQVMHRHADELVSAMKTLLGEAP